MANMIKTSDTYGNRKTILIGQESFHIALPAIIGNTGLTADSNGKKILKAGTPISGNIEKRDTAFVKASTADSKSNATAVLLHDVDVTEGNNNGTIVLAGCIDLLKLESDVKALVTAEVKTALPRVIFVEGSKI